MGTLCERRDYLASVVLEKMAAAKSEFARSVMETILSLEIRTVA